MTSRFEVLGGVVVSGFPIFWLHRGVSHMQTSTNVELFITLSEHPIITSALSIQFLLHMMLPLTLSTENESINYSQL